MFKALFRYTQSTCQVHSNHLSGILRRPVRYTQRTCQVYSEHLSGILKASVRYTQSICQVYSEHLSGILRAPVRYTRSTCQVHSKHMQGGDEHKAEIKTKNNQFIHAGSESKTKDPENIGALQIFFTCELVASYDTNRRTTPE